MITLSIIEHCDMNFKNISYKPLASRCFIVKVFSFLFCPCLFILLYSKSPGLCHRWSPVCFYLLMQKATEMKIQ